MSFEQFAQVTNDTKFGVILKVRDQDVAERFEEFMTEECFVHFVVKNEPEAVWFLFGQTASERKVGELYSLFSMATVAH